MSEFSTSPRPRIVNGVLIRECNDKNRYNGLQGTNSKEDFYRAIVEMPSPIPEADIRLAESVDAECDLHCNFSPQENCPNLENINRSAHFAHERRNTSGHSAHCDHRQAFEPQESDQQTPSFCTHSNSHNCSTSEKLDIVQDRLDSDICCEGNHLIHRNEWESGDHHRSMVDGSSALSKEGCHHPPGNCCYNAPILLNKDQPKYSYKESSTPNARRGSTLEVCQDKCHCHTCPHTHGTVLTEDKSMLRTANSTSLHEQAIDNAYRDTENCNALMRSEDPCNPKNAIREPSSRGKNRTIQYDKSEDLIHPHKSSPECLHATPQGCRPQDEQSEPNQAMAREVLNFTEGYSEEFSGYPPQRRTNRKQYNIPTEDENSSHHGNLNTKAPRNKKQECRRFIRRKFQIGNVTEQEASSVAEILNHPVVDVPEESEVLAPRSSPPLRALNSEENIGYPPQPALLRKSKYSIYRTCENDSQNEEAHCNCNAQKMQVTGHYDYSKLNDSWTRAEGEHQQTYIGQRGNARDGNEYEGYDECCRAYNKNSFLHPHMNENEHEETFPQRSVQDTVCVNQQQYNKNIYMDRSPRTFRPESQEQHYHSHYSCNTPDEEINNFSVQKLSKEAKCCAPVSREGRESHFQHGEILNDINSQRRNKELYGGSKTSSCRSVSACHEDESYRKENKHLIRAPEGQCNGNPKSSSTEGSDGYLGTDKNVSGEVRHSLQEDIAPHKELQDGEREKCLAHSTNIPTRSCCEAEHTRDNHHPRVSELNSKITEGLEEYSAAPPCEDNKLDDNTVSCPTGSPDGGSLGLPGLDERYIKKPYRRYNGLEDDDIEITNRDVSLEENNKVDTGKHRMLIQEIRQNANSHYKRETPTKLNHAHYTTGTSEERNHPSSLTPKTRIPKTKSNVHFASKKNNTAAGCLQRPKGINSPKL